FAGIILPIVITLIVITLSVFLLVALYRMCQKKTPGIWVAFSVGGKPINVLFIIKKSLGAQSDKEGVKLLSVKTTSPETGECFLWVYVCL
ncbi:MUCEN protein, partial [Syrrhaptes paradoxus]|nr:MUCEN protein [Syrrhaptes paradoxus]